MAGERATSFGAVAESYDRLRPPPPPAALDWLLPDGCAVAVDLAAGTGLLTRELERRVARVVAVEPDARMRAVLSARSPQVEAVEGRGEAIPLPDGTADAVFVSSAWHWMDPALAVPEIARVLRPGGRFGLLWTSRDSEVGWVRDLDRLRRREGATDGRRRPVRDVTLAGSAPFAGVAEASFTYTRPMALDDVVGMLSTYSGSIVADPRERAATLDRARALLRERFPGADLIDVPVRSHCWRADRNS